MKIDNSSLADLSLASMASLGIMRGFGRAGYKGYIDVFAQDGGVFPSFIVFRTRTLIYSILYKYIRKPSFFFYLKS